MAISMADYKRSIKCSGCGNEITVYMNGNFDLHELSASGKCPECKNSIQVDFALVEKEAPAESSYSDSSSESSMDSSAMDIFSQSPSETSTETEEPKKSAEEESTDIVKDLMK